MTEYPRGSEWRRWDLHVHTASSYDYKYNGADANNILIETLKQNDIKVVAITDHFVIDKERINDLRTLAPDIVFFPGVELRTDKGDSNIHVILIFSDMINMDTLREDFNVFKQNASNYADNEKIHWDYKEITEFAKKHDALISVHAGSKSSGVDDKISNALPCSQAIKEEYAKTVHIFEMGRIQDLEDYNKFVFSSIGVKPMILCSDNHDARNYNPSNKLWIKADPTFNGLKQILYEPRERILISPTKPETKSDYFVIDRVMFNDENFQADPIILNDKLNCIIGGKSTGKSILLQNIARTIDETEAEKNLEKAKNRTLDINNMSIFWRDGNDEKIKRKIIYIPQTYLNKLSDEKEETTEIDKWILDILLKNEAFKSVYDDFHINISEIKKKTNKTLVDFIGVLNEIVRLLNEQKEVGDKVGIEAEIKKLKDEKDRIAQSSEIKNEDLKQYDNAVHNVTAIESIIKKLSSDYAIINTIESLLEIKEIPSGLNEKSMQEILGTQNNILKEGNIKWAEKKQQMLKGISEEIATQTKTKTEKQAIIDHFKPLIEQNKAILDLAKKIQDEQIKLEKVIDYQKIIDGKNEKKEIYFSELILLPKKYEELHQNVINVVNCMNFPDRNLEFYSELQFRKEAFIEKLLSIYHNSNPEVKKIITPEYLTKETYSNEVIKEILEKTLTKEFPLKTNYNLETAYRDILSDWYNTSFKVRMDGDTIKMMSPGKKALVLLKVLISLADSKCPILIDQPEDDLDNRSIYKDLAEFIKEKKKERQIIVVTHNANIVIGADAEEVIVANQEGDDCKNKQYKFEYRSGSIEEIKPVIREDGSIEKGVLNEKGIQQHICDILEGGEVAFELRKKKYHI